MKRNFKTLRPIRGARDKRHGTVGGYQYWGCRCEPCTEANRVASKKLREQKLASLRPEDHGRPYTYNVGCRCEPCKSAARDVRVIKKPPISLPKVDLRGLA